MGVLLVVAAAADAAAGTGRVLFEVLQRQLLYGITDSMDMSLGELWDLVMDREAGCVVVHGVTKSQTRLSD